MGCPKCDFTDWSLEYEPESGFVETPCPECKGVDGDMPDAIADLHDAAIEAEIDAAWQEYDLDKAEKVC